MPGFAGMLLEDGVPTVYLVDTGHAALAETVLTPFLVNRGSGGRGFQVREARFPWTDLYEWRMRARHLLGMEGLRSLGISVARNRVVLGVAPGTRTGPMLERLENLGVDLEAVEVDEVSEVRRLSSLEDRVRPALGGLQISRDGLSQACTAGFNAYFEGTRTLVTAGHCMPSSSAGPMYQPLIGSSNRIGEKLLESGHHTCTPDGEPLSHRCMHSDAGLVAYDDSVDWSFGHIARTHHSGKSSGSKSIDGRFWVTDSYYMAMTGDTLHKVGWKTGWTVGLVVDVCRDFPSGSDWLICQTTVAAGAGPGDSGSPAFRRKGGGQVDLAGVVWGVIDSVFVYSPMFNIEQDFGAYIDAITSAPSPPSGLSISGPTEIEPGATCLWQGNVTGGTTPFSYEWKNNNIIVSNTDSYTGGKLSGTLGPSFTLRFTVTNDAGSAWTQITVTEDSAADPCFTF